MAAKDRPALTIFRQAGGMRVFERLAAEFYGRVERDPLLRPLFPVNMAAARLRFGWFLAETFGGPKVSQQMGTHMIL